MTRRRAWDSGPWDSGAPWDSGGDEAPENIIIVQKFRKSTLASAQRVRPGETARNYIILRNLEATNVAQIAFTTVGNNNNNPPTTGFTDINPGEEWYEVGSTNQVWFRPKVDGESCTVELEVSIPV